MTKLEEKKIKPIIKDIHIVCPNCKKYKFGSIIISDYTSDIFPKRCPNCNQSIDWSNIDEFTSRAIRD